MLRRPGRERGTEEARSLTLIVLSEVESEGLRAAFAVDPDEGGRRLEHELLVSDDDTPASGRMVRGGRSAREEKDDALEVILLGTGLNITSDTTDVGVVYDNRKCKCQAGGEGR
jgi:hypothetical protein